MSPRQIVGWSLKEAICQTVDPVLLKRFLTAEKEYRCSGSSDLSNTSSNRRPTRKSNRPTLDDAVIADLRSHLISGRLVAYGRATRYATDLTPIPSAAWVQLVFRDCRRSIVAEGGSRSPIITDVRIFPVLYVDDIVDCLHGMPLVQAFRDYVFGDFQLACLQKKPIRYGGEHRQLSSRPALYSSYWDVRHGEVPERGTLGYYMDGRDGPAAHHANEVLRLRFGRVVSLLAEEKLIADGVSRSDGSRVSIPSAMWLRREAHLDLTNGDYFDRYPGESRNLEGKVFPLYLGLTLRRAQAQSLHVKHTDRDDLQSAPTADARTSKGILTAAERQRIELECKKWLAGLMNASPLIRTYTNEWLLKEAERLWPNISGRSFVTARKAAILQTGAVAWGVAGATPKSRHYNRRGD